MNSSAAARPRGRASGGLVVRLAVAAGLTAYILWKSHPRAVIAVTSRADWRLVFVAVLLVLVDRTLMAYRWLVLLCIVDRADRPPLWAIMRIFFVSTFVGTFLPASIGGDAVRAYSIRKLNVGGGEAVASVLMDRIMGVASILLMAIIGLALATDLVSNWTIVTALAVAGAVCLFTLLLIFSSRVAAIVVRTGGWLPERSRGGVERVFQSIRRYSAFHRQLANVLACSVGVQLLRIVQAYYLGRGLGIDVPVATYFAFIPLILLVILLPVTFNGIGTAQAAFVWFFARAGVSSPLAFALSVLFIALGIVGNLPGGILYVWGRGRRADMTNARVSG